MSLDPTIFVQIASYRDPECQWTVWDLFSKADRPGRITVGICWQYDPYRDMDCFTAPSPRPQQTKIISVLPSETQGVCWARAQVQTLFQDQDFVLMIDSHMRFIKGWDTALIRELWRCPAPKPFLSNYPPGYKPPDRLEAHPKFVVLRAKPFNDAGDIRFDGEYLPVYPPAPLHGAFLAAGFIFAAGKFIRELPYDPYMYFDHEEVTLAARAYTHGWDVFCPSRTFLYHYYPDIKKGEKRALHWFDRQDWEKFLHRSRARYNYLLAGKTPANPDDIIDMGLYGLGRERTLGEFEEFSGLDFKAKTASAKALQAGFIKDIDQLRKSTPKSTAVGDRLPLFTLLDVFGKTHQARALTEGRPCLFCVLPGDFDSYMREFFALYCNRENEIKATDIRIFFVAPVTMDKLKSFRRRHSIPREVMADESKALFHAFGLADNLHQTPLTVGVNDALAITGIYTNRNAENHINDILREARRLGSQKKSNSA
jgi:peroxiredoxin